MLATQFRVIGALVLRETRATFGTTRFGYLWAILMPTLSTIVLVAVFTAVGRQPPFGTSFAVFFATGVLTLEVFNKLSDSLMSSFEANQALLAYPPIWPLDVVVARTILVSCTYILVMASLYGVLCLFDNVSPPVAPETVFGAFVGTTFLAFSFGLINAVVVSIWQSWRYVERILTRPLFFVS